MQVAIGVALVFYGLYLPGFPGIVFFAIGGFCIGSWLGNRT